MTSFRRLTGLPVPYRRRELAAKVRQVLDARPVVQPVTAPVRRRVVVVEDNDDARDMLRELLLILDYDPLCFGSADACSMRCAIMTSS